jgi:hypothetical protein
MDLLLAGDVELFHCARPRHFNIRLDLFVDATNDVLENVFVGKPEVNKEREGHGQIARDESSQIHHQRIVRGVFVVNLKAVDAADVHDEKDNRDDAVVQAELREWPRERSQKSESMAIVDIACDVKSHCKAGCAQPHDKETCEVYLVEVLGVEKEIGDSDVSAETSADHRDEHDPAKKQNVIALDVIQQ